MERQDYERMSKVEGELTGIKELLQKLDGKFDGLTNSFVPRNELSVMFSQRDREIDRQGREIEALETRVEDREKEKRTSLPVWVAIIISAMALLSTLYQIITGG